MNDKLSAGEREALADLLATDPPTSAVVWVVERILAARLADADARLAAVEALVREAETIHDAHERWNKRGEGHRPCESSARVKFARHVAAALHTDPSEDA